MMATPVLMTPATPEPELAAAKISTTNNSVSPVQTNATKGDVSVDNVCLLTVGVVRAQVAVQKAPAYLLNVGPSRVASAKLKYLLTFALTWTFQEPVRLRANAFPMRSLLRNVTGNSAMDFAYNVPLPVFSL